VTPERPREGHGLSGQHMRAIYWKIDAIGKLMIDGRGWHSTKLAMIIDGTVWKLTELPTNLHERGEYCEK